MCVCVCVCVCVADKGVNDWIRHRSTNKKKFISLKWKQNFLKNRSYKDFSCKKSYWSRRKYFKKESEDSCVKSISYCYPILKGYILSKKKGLCVNMSLCVKENISMRLTLWRLLLKFSSASFSWNININKSMYSITYSVYLIQLNDVEIKCFLERKVYRTSHKRKVYRTSHKRKVYRTSHKRQNPKVSWVNIG